MVELLKQENLLMWAMTIGFSCILYALLRLLQNVLIKKGTSKAAATATLVDDLVVQILSKIHKFFLFFLSVYIGLASLKMPDSNRLMVDKIFILILLFQIAQLSGLIINFWFNQHLKLKAPQDLATVSTLNLITIVIRGIVYAVIFLLALNNLGVDITALVAGLGIGGVAVALALQNILADLFSSLTIVLDKPFIVGDFIVVNDLMGTIEHIGLKTTRLRSLSGEQLIFGNQDLLQSRIKNYKRMKERRVAQSLTVTYQTSADVLEKIPQTIERIIKAEEAVRFDRCHFLSFQESALASELVYWVQSPDFNFYADCAQRINLAILREFNKLKINFAHPTQTLFIQRGQSTSK